MSTFTLSSMLAISAIVLVAYILSLIYKGWKIMNKWLMGIFVLLLLLTLGAFGVAGWAFWENYQDLRYGQSVSVTGGLLNGCKGKVTDQKMQIMFKLQLSACPSEMARGTPLAALAMLKRDRLPLPLDLPPFGHWVAGVFIEKD